MRNNILSMLGICNKAGKLVMGKDKTIETIRKNKAKLIIIASDLSDNALKEISRETMKKQIEIINISEKMQDVSLELGRTTGIICITDEGIAKKIKTLLD